MKRLWCRLFHMDAWLLTNPLAERAGERLAIRCVRCRLMWSFRIAIPAKAPVGRTPA